MAEESAVSRDSRPWGWFATFVLGTVALLAGQLAGMAALVSWYGFDLRNVSVLSQHGAAIIVFIFVSAPVQVAILALAAGYKGNIAEYLGYKMPRRGEVVLCVAVLAAMIVIGNTMSWLAGRSIVDRFQIDIYQAADSVGQLPLLFAAVVILIPIGEETLFRGFLMRGWLRSSHSARPVILATAALFAIIHVQYDWFLIGQVFAFGVLFGWARWATGSTLLTVALHALVNLEGMLETFLSLNG